MTVGHFQALMREWHPELVPPGSMPLREAIRWIADQVNFRAIHAAESMERVLDELWIFI